MKTVAARKSDIDYIANLTRASYDGLTFALREGKGTIPSPLLTSAVWVPAAVGATIGILAARLVNRKSPAYRVALVGAAGTAIGFGAGVGFKVRRSAETVLRSSMQKVNAVRDAHWLERNPINYA